MPVRGWAKREGTAGQVATQVLVEGSASGKDALVQVALQVESTVSEKSPSRQVA